MGAVRYLLPRGNQQLSLFSGFLDSVDRLCRCCCEVGLSCFNRFFGMGLSRLNGVLLVAMLCRRLQITRLLRQMHPVHHLAIGLVTGHHLFQQAAYQRHIIGIQRRSQTIEAGA